MSLLEKRCPTCNSSEIKGHSRYKVHSGETRWIYHCLECGSYFSETKHTFLEGLRTPLSRIARILDALNDGMGINAVCRIFKVSKNTIYSWLDRLGSLKETLLFYALCHQFLVHLIEGDEVYTRVHENKPPEESEGWTVGLMDRASRFIWELRCGEKTQSLFEKAIQTLGQVIAQTEDLSLLTDGERRPVRPLSRRAPHRQGGSSSDDPKKGVKVRIKNKGAQKHKRGPKRPTVQAPIKEHPQTPQPLQTQGDSRQSLRSLQQCSKATSGVLQTAYQHLRQASGRLPAYWGVHNFVRPHSTTQQVPAVALGILKKGLSFEQLFKIQRLQTPTN